MKFALVGPVYPYRGGIAHYTTLLYKSLQGHDHDLLMVSFKRQYPQWLFPGQSDKDPSEKPLLAEGAKYWIDSLNPFTWLLTAWRIIRYQPDALILQWWTPFWAPAWLLLGLSYRLLVRRPLLMLCHNVLPHEASFIDRWVSRWVLRCGTQFVVQSESEKLALQKLLTNAPVQVVKHPIYDMFAEQRISKKQARDRLNLPEDAAILLFFGIVRKYKGLADLLQALALSIKTLPDKILLVIAGEFWEPKQSYIELIEGLGISNSVVIDDRYIPNEEVSLYFYAADLLVAPYKTATGSGVVQMALGFGTPCLTTSVNADCEAASSCLFVPPGDVMALSQEIVNYFLHRDCQGSSSETEQDEDTSWAKMVCAIENAALSLSQ